MIKIKHNEKKITDKQKLILYMVYCSYYLPIKVLDNFPVTFSKSNLQYKLIPRLIKTGYAERILIGYNKKYGENDIQKGKGIRDTLKITNEGIKYLGTVGTQNTINQLSQIRNYYKNQILHGSTNTEERLKRTIMTDYMFDPLFVLGTILGTCELKKETCNDILLDLQNKDDFKFLHGIECKRRNLDISELREVEKIEDYTQKTGKSLSASKFFGLVESKHKTIPVYFAGYYNVDTLPKNETLLANKISAETGKICNDAIYVYQSLNKIRGLMERESIVQSWQNTHNIIDVLEYARIYLLPYGRNSTEYEHLKLQLDIEDIDMRLYWERINCFEYHDYVFAKPHTGEALRNSLGTFISITDEYNYIIGYLPELRHLRQVLSYYRNNINAKPLCIVCEETQKEFYETIFDYIKQRDKLYFLFSEFKKEENKT